MTNSLAINVGGKDLAWRRGGNMAPDDERPERDAFDYTALRLLGAGREAARGDKGLLREEGMRTLLVVVPGCQAK
jgi:hypothetical protein